MPEPRLRSTPDPPIAIQDDTWDESLNDVIPLASAQGKAKGKKNKKRKRDTSPESSASASSSTSASSTVSAVPKNPVVVAPAVADPPVVHQSPRASQVATMRAEIAAKKRKANKKKKGGAAAGGPEAPKPALTEFDMFARRFTDHPETGPGNK